MVTKKSPSGSLSTNGYVAVHNNKSFTESKSVQMSSM